MSQPTNKGIAMRQIDLEDENHPDYWQVGYERCQAKGGSLASDSAPCGRLMPIDKASLESPTNFRPYHPPRIERSKIMEIA